MRPEHEYTTAEIVFEEASWVVSRATREGRPVLLRRSTKECPPSPRELAKIRYGAAVVQSLGLPGIVAVLAVEQLRDGVLVVLEDFGGLPLRRLLGQRRIEVLEALAIAREVAKILGDLRRARVVHGNVHPDSIHVDTASGAVKLASFDRASRLARERPIAVGASRLEGALAYISPEQTGRMNRTVDHRTDLYSLGVTLYEMLAGRVPFDAAEPLALVHGHLAVAPEPPHRIRPTVDAAVSTVVMKLLAKHAEDRYQTAEGLIADLEECSSQLEASGTIGDFVPGAHDVGGDLQIPEKLHGRDGESAALLAAFERVSSGGAELVLVSGAAGAGKSALVNELRRPVTERRGHFISGELDGLHKAPLGALSQAFQALILELLSESEKKIATLRKRLREALGASGQVVIDVIPEVALLVGEQPPLPALGLAESQSRFDLVFQRFISVFARREHPLVLVLEELQWADSASLRLIRLLLADPGTRHLLIVGTYRADAHPPSIALAQLRDEQPPAAVLATGPLDPGDVRRLILDTLGCPDDAAAHDFARFLHETTAGDPFFVHQLLIALQARRLLTFSVDAGAWQWSLQGLREIRVEDLLTERIQALPAAAQRLVRLAAGLGATFDLETLALLDGRTPVEVAADLQGALLAGVILPIGDDYRYLEMASEPLAIQYAFLHDRVREAAYALLDADAGTALHLRIGRLLEARLPEARRAARIFEIASHLDRGEALLEGAEERRHAARLHLDSAERARRWTAHDVTLHHLDVATRLLGPDAWTTARELAFAIEVLRAECDHRLGHVDEAMARRKVALAHAATTEEKARIHALQVLACASRGDAAGARRASAAALALHGVTVPTDAALDAALDAESASLSRLLAGRELPLLLQLPGATDPASRARTALLAQSLVLGGEVGSGLFSLAAIRLVRESLEHGVSPGSSLGYVTYAAAHGAKTGDHATSHALAEVALGLAERLDDLPLRARVELWFGAFVNPWCRPVRTSYPYLERSYAALLESGSPRGAGVAAVQSIFLPLLGGDELLALKERTRRHHDAQVRLGCADNAELLSCLLQGMTRLTRGSAPPDRSPDRGEPAAAAPTSADLLLRFTRELLDLHVAFLFGEHPRALALATSAASHLHVAFGHLAEAELRFLRALATAALLPTSTPEERQSRLALFEEDRDQIARWAGSCPENFGYKSDLVRAEEARLLGDNEAAMALYDQAIDGAAEQEIIHHQAIAGELAARFYLARGHRKIARAYLADARHAYLRWGATAKVAALDAEHADLLPRGGIAARHGGEGSSSGAFDLLAILEQSRSISRELVLDGLLRELMSAVLESTFAQRGLLLLAGDHEIIVETGGGAEAILVTDATVDDRADVARSIVRYVERTRESVVLADAATTGQFRSDPYVATSRPRSILCVPILAPQQLVGILYLENNLLPGAFTGPRCEAAELLAAQAAIALENARRYDALENRVKERAQELGSSNEELALALRRLKDTQKQLITQDKLASLGALTSGIAHEIKNPLNFINNFAELSIGLGAELLSLIQAQRARLDPASVAQIDEIIADLQQNAAKINQHGRRADDIVRAMLEHSRSGAGERREVDVNTLLADHVSLAYQGFRSQDTAFSVSIETCYDPGVGALFLPSQEIGRVFLNLINNACYAVRAQRQHLGERFSPTIRVSTRSLGDHVEIRVRDNGAGIPTTVREKIFHPFFTTKPPGDGTGLGLSISHEIVESNGGTLAFDTIVGLFTEFIITLPRLASPGAPRQG